jgi:hypothetical protein
MEIYILSSGRADRQITWNAMPRMVQDQTKIVVPWDERADYSNYPVLTHKDIIRDVTRTRQWLIERAKHKICMFDDDLSFATRIPRDPTKFKPMSMEEFVAMMDSIEAKLRSYAHVGVSGREGANRRVEDILYIGRMVRVLAYDARVMKKLGIRIDRLKLMADFDVTLQFLRAGYGNAIINWAVQNQAGSNARGGCSAYRTPEMQRLDAIALQKLHPDFVTLVHKEIKSKDPMWQNRLDVRVQWKKAYESC